MKHLRLPLFLALTASASAGTTIYTDSTAFFSSSTWTNAASGAAFTENFVASGGLRNFTGNEQFVSNSFTYGSGELANTMTISRQDGLVYHPTVSDAQDYIYVDTSNEAGSFLSYDNPGTTASSSKYLYIKANYLGEGVTISFSQPISSFAFRLGDFGDPGTSGGLALYSGLQITSRNTAVNGSLDTLVWDDPVRVSETGAQLDLSQSTGVPGYTPMNIGDDQWAFMAWTFDTPVDEITINQSQSTDDSWGIDTISFSTVAVPEPSSVAMIALGSLALLRRMRRKAD